NLAWRADQGIIACPFSFAKQQRFGFCAGNDEPTPPAYAHCRRVTSDLFALNPERFNSIFEKIDWTLGQVPPIRIPCRDVQELIAGATKQYWWSRLRFWFQVSILNLVMLALVRDLAFLTPHPFQDFKRIF